jgi:hypothetical protein
VQKEIRARKFYATLKYKLDQAEEDWLAEQPEAQLTSEFTEVLEGETPLGGEMRRTFKPLDDT